MHFTFSLSVVVACEVVCAACGTCKSKNETTVVNSTDQYSQRY